MSKPVIFTGSGVALVTPMFEDGSVNFEELDRLIDFQIENDTDAIITCGTTGESSTLDHEEHCAVMEHTVKRVAGRIPVIAGCGSNDTRYCVELSSEAKKLGADALLLVTPYYNKSSQSGLIRHYTYVADRIDLPIILYNVPSRTGCNIKPETYAVLADHPGIVGIKEANGDISSVAKTMALCGDKIALYSGNDDQTLPILSLGGKGVISVFANVFPKEMHELVQSYLEGNTARSLELQLHYLDLMNDLFIDVNPIPVKAAVNLMGFRCGECRMPLAPLSEVSLEILKSTMKKHHLI